jgi:hypothetical protein
MTGNSNNEYYLLKLITLGLFFVYFQKYRLNNIIYGYILFT